MPIIYVIARLVLMLCTKEGGPYINNKYIKDLMEYLDNIEAKFRYED